MDIKKEFEECRKKAPIDGAMDFAEDYRGSLFDGYVQALFFYLGAKRAEELLLSDPLVVDLRKVEWPAFAKSVKFYFSKDSNHVNMEDFILLIPRPKPAWVPVVREAVFYNATVGDGASIDNTVPFVGRFVGEYEGYYTVIMATGEKRHFAHDLVKPFSPDSIGKRWEEI